MNMSYEIIENESGNGRDSGNPAIIKVIGAGGGGSNAVNSMMSGDMRYVDFIVVNTDMQALQYSKAPTKLAIGAKLTGGLGAGGNPDIGEQAAREDKETIANAIKNADMLFITAGMGGGTGTGSAPVIAEIAKDLGILTVAVVTKPFTFEGKARMRLAEEGIEKLRKSVDAVIVIPNQHLLKIVEATTPVPEAFKKVDEVLHQAVQGISDLIYRPGLVNVDLADVKTAMRGQGNAHMGIGIGRGETRAVDAATNAINNPLLEETRIEGAKHLLVNICGSNDLTLHEVDEIMDIINANADPAVSTCFGANLDPSVDDTVTVTLIATGFPSNSFFECGQKPATLEKKEESSLGENSFISSGQWASLNKPEVLKPPVISGIGVRNTSGDDSKNSAKEKVSALEFDFDAQKNSFSIGVPPDGTDLDLPAYYRVRRGK